MSFEEFIKGASDVCYRPFTWSTKMFYSNAEDVVDQDGFTEKEYSRMLTYLGEVKIETSQSNSTPYFEVFLNNLPKQYQDICHNLIKVRLGIQESQTIDLTRFYGHSLDIFRFLLTELTSENRVKAIRTVYKVLDDATKISPVYTNISSGSKDVADSWLIRNRSSLWPPTDVILNSVSHGILLVPIGSKFGSSEDCSFEWRISFSLQERDLIHSFNCTQVLCYTSFKYLKYDLLKESGLCSYFIKTAIFWLCEELDNNMWIPEHFVQCMHEIQRRLIYWFRYGYCPHYFITANNLFEGLLPEERKYIEVELINVF
ncbi:Hypothetical predicted protein [Mytilus galloprovincialis]|uniref:Mab-21-like HhH/H2TH-like domain-containing protein n=1 Tax=Mytilus galloprovincialis TaxID=29158 RepID=A0A8B6CP83_MYTGA|nr:Hypothetical predicted protein [Mytilus galloprovincialis]